MVSCGVPLERGVRGSNTKAKNIFHDYLKKPTIFKDKSRLTTTFVPDEILHRDHEINQLSLALAPSLRGYQPNNVFVYGTCGTGKTMVTRYVLNQLSEMSYLNGGSLKTIYINCKMKRVADTEYRLIAQILKDFGINVPDTGLSTNTLYRRFFEEIDSKEQIIILALDEIDSLFKKIGDDFLYSLTRINSELKSKISIIGITNDLLFYDNLDLRVKSSLGEEEILFKPYNALQLKDILMRRCDSFYSMPSEGVLNKIAAIAASEHGDARRAIDLLRVSGEIAERSGEKHILEEHVDLAKEKIDSDKIIECVKNQPKHSRIVLYAIIKLNENKEKRKNGFIDNRILSGDVYEYYKELCNSHGLNPLTQRRVSDLINELDILGIINSKIISKGRYGRTREINLAINNNILLKLEKNLVF